MQEWSKCDCIHNSVRSTFTNTDIEFYYIEVSIEKEHSCLMCVSHIKWNLFIGTIHWTDECTTINVQNCCNVSGISAPFYTIIIMIKWYHCEQLLHVARLPFLNVSMSVKPNFLITFLLSSTNMLCVNCPFLKTNAKKESKGCDSNLGMW